jgi:hypothetical protein
MPKFNPESPHPRQERRQTEQAEGKSERETNLLITFQERRLFEEAGGEYRGLVDTSDGRKFEEFWVGRRAYYDREQRKVLETYVETTATDAEESEIEGPEEVKGYEVLIVKRDSSSHEVGEPVFVDLYPKNFMGRRIGTQELREYAMQVHDYVLRNAEQNLQELARGAEEFLRQRGWRGKAY